MKNLFDIQCPVCGNADDLHMEGAEAGDIILIRLGGWAAAQADEARIELACQLWGHTPVSCAACGYEGACETFAGSYPAWTRRISRLMSRFQRLVKLG